MKYLLLLALLFATDAMGASFTITGTMPDLGSDTTSCVAPILSPMPAGTLVRAHVHWIGPVTGEDSTLAAAMLSPFSFARNVPAGIYTMRVWWSRISIYAGPGCDTTFAFTAGGPPWRKPIIAR